MAPEGELYTKLKEIIERSGKRSTFQDLGEAQVSPQELLNQAGQRLLRAMVNQGESNG